MNGSLLVVVCGILAAGRGAADSGVMVVVGVVGGGRGFANHGSSGLYLFIFNSFCFCCYFLYIFFIF
ncbi:hypothetical protein RND81_05G058400 [Saponaria officinalis]|uniref:Secreted protein n=1 Tax=Saponaria officinalis TaxID=3572 RepID=A0AAW1KTN9_SAPOF